MAKKYVKKSSVVTNNENKDENIKQDDINVIPVESNVNADEITDNLFDEPIEHTVTTTETSIEQNKKFGKIILLKDVAGMKGGTVIDIINIDDSDNVHFKIGNLQTFLTPIERGKLWDFNEKE